MNGDDEAILEGERALEVAIRRAGLLDAAALERARRFAAAQRVRLAAAISDLGLAPETALASALAAASGCEKVEAAELERRCAAVPGVGPRFLRERRIIAIGDEAVPELAMADPFDDFAYEAYRLATGLRPRRRTSEAAEIERAIDRLYGPAAPAQEPTGATQSEEIAVERLKDLASEAPVVQLVNAIIAAAIEERASDIHFEPHETGLGVRFRVDGALRPGPNAPDRLRAAVVSRLKIMARLDIAERRLPQDGRIKTVARGRTIDLRVSTIPGLHGESVAIRLLDRDDAALDFEALGLAAPARAALARILSRPNGIFLVTGPTGSGKTTTLYAALAGLRTPEKKLLSVEDPIEYQMAGVDQVQVRSGIGLDFARVLRAMLRHDPDIIMVGEIRDGETARIAAQAALTGHLVLSTLHTNDAAGAVVRLMDMGVKDYVIAATLSGVASQRLVRRLCPACREAYDPPPELAERIGLSAASPPRLWRAVGCEACGGRGYRGRTAIIEVMPATEALRRLILEGAPVETLRAAAVAEGMTPIWRDGLARAEEGATSIEEILAVAGPE